MEASTPIHPGRTIRSRTLEEDSITTALEFAELAALPVADAVHPDGHLWLWVTTTHLGLAFQLVEAWGFQYKTTAVWRKDRLGIGWWLISRHEFLLFAAKSTRHRANPGTFSTEIRGRYRGHSHKPVETYTHIESLSPGPYLELFSREEEQRQGWTRLGANGVPTEAYNQPHRLLDQPDQADGVVRGVGGLEIHPEMQYRYMQKEVIYVPVTAISQKGRRVTVQFADGVKKSVSIDKLRPAEEAA